MTLFQSVLEWFFATAGTAIMTSQQIEEGNISDQTKDIVEGLTYYFKNKHQDYFEKI